MAIITISERPANREWLTRDWSLYTLTIYKDHRMTGFEVMTEAQARAYFAKYPGGRTIGVDQVDFDSPMSQFTYEVAK